MAGLFGTLNIGSQSLFASRQGIDTTSHNIANAQTEGYSKQRLQLRQRDPVERHGIIIGTGAYVGSIDRSHDKFVERQVNQAASAVGSSEARMKAIGELEGIFSPELTSNVSDELNNFFGALQTLAKYPEELTARASVREQGKSLAEAFGRVDLEVRQHRDGLNQHVQITADEVNELLTGLAGLNQRVRELETGPAQEANDLRDQRDLLLRKLTGLIDVHYYDDKDGMLTIHGPGQSLLVDRSRAARFEVAQDPSNDGLFKLQVIDSGGGSPRDVTRHLRSGKMQALVEVRDVVDKTLLEKNNHMASGFIEHFNSVHRQGYGLQEFREANGRDFFEPVDDPSHAAQNMQLSIAIINSTDAISAASVAHAPGDNINANLLIKLQGEQLFPEGSATLQEFYADYVSVLGMESVRARHLSESDSIIFADLASRREAVAGVSLDEEAADMIRWQTAFTASSKVITTVDEMLETILGLKR